MGTPKSLGYLSYRKELQSIEGTERVPETGKTLARSTTAGGDGVQAEAPPTQQSTEPSSGSLAARHHPAGRGDYMRKGPPKRYGRREGAGGQGS